VTFYHVWFSTKGRKPALVDEIDEMVRATLIEIASRTNVKIVEMETALDHVHLLLSLNAGQKLPVVIHDLKGASAREVFRRFPELRLDMKSNVFWQKSYGARRVPVDEQDTVREYIRTQSDRPLRRF
jgi:putative transposase